MTPPFPPTGRYAPSPTGALHLGNLRTALAAWAFARSRGGRFLLRIEDIDTPRVQAGCEREQLRDLQALGIDWDGEPLRQSGRTSLYAEYTRRALEAGAAYPCFCSRKDIQLALSAPHAEEGTAAYPGTCRDLDAAEVARRLGEGRRHSLRLRVDRAPATFADGFAEEAPPPLAASGDFVIRRADGLFAYQLACAVDDALSGVTEVLRGDDLLDSGARQAWLLRCLGLPVPSYYHIPLMMDSGGGRLSKRAGSDDLSAYLAAGVDATAVRSYLAWTLGQCGPGERLTPAELASRFRLEAIPRTPAIFRVEDLRMFTGK
ncbi:MAG: glutamyl-tRNA synthetase [Candidatus Sumerlaeota bacterium]|nr:glutamyl-tRNA synthetase [Candidatus Sumerlaeota bacterium]